MPARQTARTELYRLITKHELVDIWRQRNPQKRVFTWSRTDSTTNKIICSRIDRILIDKHLDNNVTKVDIIPYQHSDHDATTIIIDVVKLKRGAGYWHFNNKLLTDAQFTQDIRTFWADWTAQKANQDNPPIWWDKAKYSFKQIAIQHSIRRSRADKFKRTELEQKISQLQSTANSTGSPEDTIKYLEARNELKQFDLSELEAIKIRTKAEYTEQGEKSTRYFYSLQKRKQAEQSIKILTEENNECCTVQQDILKEVHAYYKLLYSSEDTNQTSQEKIFNEDCPTLSEEARNSCEGYITLPELRRALNDMELNKSPGLDGLTSNFYKHFWDLFGNELADIYNYGFEHEILSVTQRRGVITLIFKKNDRTKLKNWRPITLLTTDYKILTKALANRLKNVLPMIIHTDQTACVKGRTINDNASLIRDAIYYANETNKKLAIITVDQLKAFDRVNHGFLFKTLEKFGFGSQFIKWIKILYKQVCSSVKVNSWLTAFIGLERGLRQGCPLSMPLYILTAEILALQIRANKQIQGLTLPDSEEQVKLSQYADDTTLLVANDRSINEVLRY